MVKLRKMPEAAHPDPLPFPVVGYYASPLCAHCGGPIEAGQTWIGVVGFAGQQAPCKPLCYACGQFLLAWLNGEGAR